MPPLGRMRFAPSASMPSIRCDLTNCGAGQARLWRPDSVAKTCVAVSLTPGESRSKSRPRSIMRAHSGWLTAACGRMSP